MDQLVAMRTFRRVVERESFSAAARDLGLSNAAASKNVGELEARLGVRLLARTTRRMSVTEAGEAYYRRCVRILEEIDEAEREAASRAAEPRGTLRVSAPMSFGLAHVAPAIPDFLAAFTGVSVDLVMNDRYVDLVEEGFDVAVRAGGGLKDSSLIARRLAPLRRVVCGAPAYLAAHGTPRTPGELADHHCLVYSLARSPREWLFDGPQGQRVTVAVDGRYAVNSSLALQEALLAGLGLALVPTFVVADALRRGQLEPVLTDWQPEAQFIHAVHIHRRYVSPKVRSFIDFLVDRFGPHPYWDT